MAEIVILQDQTDGDIYDKFPAGQYSEEKVSYFANVLQGALTSAGIENPNVQPITIVEEQ